MIEFPLKAITLAPILILVSYEFWSTTKKYPPVAKQLCWLSFFVIGLRLMSIANFLFWSKTIVMGMIFVDMNCSSDKLMAIRSLKMRSGSSERWIFWVWNFVEFKTV
jgi:hypothetical protein